MAETIDEHDRPWGGMGDRIRETRPAIRERMNVFVDGDRAGLETPLAPGAEVYVLTAIIGGEALVVKIRRLVPGRVLTGADAMSVLHAGLWSTRNLQYIRRLVWS
ncbi:hypothetical protein [Aquibium sp. ELW1220]|uniref:MoaD/ThiS family protein n=1 Tax=Aquibium sp. ELW1220 TaxID=2976766 RepID=UPI0025AF99AF|nr:hypothetical protein [Aquibium sp. ELW1220]MDN2580411.1 hypothetical protein [Aquibium sp. ELW1220]